MSILAVSRLPRELDTEHVMCHRCGITKRRDWVKNPPSKPITYWCRDCTPYRDMAA